MSRPRITTSDQDGQIVAMLRDESIPVKSIIKKFGLDYAAVRRIGERNGLPPRNAVGVKRKRIVIPKGKCCILCGIIFDKIEEGVAEDDSGHRYCQTCIESYSNRMNIVVKRWLRDPVERFHL